MSANPKVSPWRPTTNLMDLAHLGKLAEELGECSAAVARCTIQGIEEAEPVTGKPNRQWLEEEIGDVLAGIELAIRNFDLNRAAILARRAKKINYLTDWHDIIQENIDTAIWE